MRAVSHSLQNTHLTLVTHENSKQALKLSSINGEPEFSIILLCQKWRFSDLMILRGDVPLPVYTYLCCWTNPAAGDVLKESQRVRGGSRFFGPICCLLLVRAGEKKWGALQGGLMESRGGDTWCERDR